MGENIQEGSQTAQNKGEYMTECRSTIEASIYKPKKGENMKLEIDRPGSLPITLTKGVKKIGRTRIRQQNREQIKCDFHDLR